jgi:dATP pyrophosphohydrolase
MRAPFQVLVLPYRWRDGNLEFLILRVKDFGYWAFVAGGGEDNETPREAAERECREEIGIEGKLLQLDSQATIPRNQFLASKFWDEDVYVVPEISFAIEFLEGEILLSGEHSEFRWVEYEEGIQLLKWDSNRNALWELNERLRMGD